MLVVFLVEPVLDIGRNHHGAFFFTNIGKAFEARIRLDLRRELIGDIAETDRIAFGFLPEFVDKHGRGELVLLLAPPFVHRSPETDVEEEPDPSRHQQNAAGDHGIDHPGRGLLDGTRIMTWWFDMCLDLAAGAVGLAARRLVHRMHAFRALAAFAVGNQAGGIRMRGMHAVGTLAALAGDHRTGAGQVRVRMPAGLAAFFSDFSRDVAPQHRRPHQQIQRSQPPPGRGFGRRLPHRLGAGKPQRLFIKKPFGHFAGDKPLVVPEDIAVLFVELGRFLQKILGAGHRGDQFGLVSIAFLLKGVRLVIAIFPAGQQRFAFIQPENQLLFLFGVLLERQQIIRDGANDDLAIPHPFDPPGNRFLGGRIHPVGERDLVAFFRQREFGFRLRLPGIRERDTITDRHHPTDFLQGFRLQRFGSDHGNGWIDDEFAALPQIPKHRPDYPVLVANGSQLVIFFLIFPTEVGFFLQASQQDADPFHPGD